MLCIFMLASTSGCNFFAPPAAQQTLAADHAARGTEIVAVRQTATLQSDRLLATVEFAQTAVRSADQQSTRIASTLAAAGAPSIDISRITPVAPADQAQTTDNSAGQTAIIAGQGGAQGNITIQPTAPPTPLLQQNVSPQNDPTAPALVDLTISSGVGANDCALGAITTLPDTAEGVYLVATARNLSPSNVVTARFLRDGVQVTFYDWSPRFEIAEACIWFYMPAADVEFLPGAWSTTLELNGQAVATSPTFSVTGTTDAAAAGSSPDTTASGA